MKKTMLLLIAILLSQSFVPLHATEQRTNHYTQVIVYFAMNSLTAEYDATKYMQKHIESMAWIKTIMERTDTTMNLHQVAFGPFPLADDPARDSIIAVDGNDGKRILAYRSWSGMNQALKDPKNPVAQKVQDIKNQTEADVITIVIITNNKYYVSHGESNSPIMVITNSSDKDNHLAIYNKMIFDETSTKAKGYFAQYPKGHTLYPKEYATIFQFSPTIWIYPRKGLYQDQFGFWLQVGDDDHNVLDPEHGWKLDYLYNKGQLALGVHTIPDTLTIKQDQIRWWELYPGWNDSQTGKVLYVGGDHIHIRREMYPNELHVAYKSFGQDAGETDLVAYAVAINDIPDAFAMDYILVQFVEDITYPSLDKDKLPTDVKSGDEFTIYLKGDYALMTSWEPVFTVSGIEYELVSQTNHSITIKALTGGNATITLHHNSLLVLPDESVEVPVIMTSSVEEYPAPEISISPNPASDYLNIQFNLSDFHAVALQITDMMGLVQNEMNAKGTEIFVSLPVYALPAGIYFLHINIDGQTTVREFIKN